MVGGLVAPTLPEPNGRRVGDGHSTPLHTGVSVCLCGRTGRSPHSGFGQHALTSLRQITLAWLVLLVSRGVPVPNFAL